MFDAGARMLAGTDLDGHDRFPEVPRALQEDRVVSRLGPRSGRARGAGRPSRSRPTAHAACSTLRRSLDEPRRRPGAWSAGRSWPPRSSRWRSRSSPGIALATRLVRRLTALRGTALRDGRARARRHAAGRRRPPRRGRRPRPRVRDDAAAAGGAGAVAAHVRQHRLARAAHAADLAGADAARRDRGARPTSSRTCPRRATSCGGRSGRPTGSASSPPSCSTSAASTPASSCAPSRSSWSSSPARCSRSSPPASRAPSSRRTAPTWVRADPGAVARIARILLNNAHRHGGPDGRVVVRVDAPGRARGERRRARRRARRGGADLRALPARPGGRRGRRLRARAGDRPRARRADGRRAAARPRQRRDVPRHLPRGREDVEPDA